MVYFHKLTVLLLVIAGVLTAAAKPVSTDSVEVSLLVCSPGSEVYELEGHAGLRLRSEAAGYDVVVNYGLFDFASPNFVYRFVKGQTDYMGGICDFSDFKNLYLSENRTITEWPLAIGREQGNRLVELIAENMRPENRTYRYNYLADNCSTRPVRIIERAVGDSIVFVAPEFSHGWTFRDAMRYYHRNYPWYQFGIDLALGSGIDYEISSQDKIFAPVLLNEMIGSARYAQSAQPVVAGDATVYSAVKVFTPDDSRPLPITPLGLGWTVFVVAAGVTIRDLRRRKLTRWFDAGLMALYGLAGCVLAFLVFVSSHPATSPNWLLVWLNPFCLIVPIFIYIKKATAFVLSYEIVNFVAVLFLAVMWPWLGQSGNMAFIPLAGADMLLGGRYIYLALCERKATVS